MRITNIRAEVVHASVYSNYVFVIAETDEGVLGFGDATLDGLEFEVVAAVKNLGSRLVGKDVLDDDCSVPAGGGGLITAAAASGIDIAMWDLKGKALNVPVYKLLGGAIRKTVPVYASFNRAIRDRTPEGFGVFAGELVAKGNRALKCHPFDGVSWRTPLADQKRLVDLGCERFIAMREAVGDDIAIGVDAHWRFDMKTAMYVADKLRPYNPFWLETPIPEKKPELLRKIREECGLLVAGAEMQTGSEALLPLLREQSLDVYMPDIRYVGGITGMMKVNALLEAYDVLISPHNMCSVITCAASLHTAAAMKNFMHLEYHPAEAPWLREFSDHYWDVENGTFTVPEGPGLGVNLNLDMLKEHPYEKAKPLRLNMLGA